MYISKKQCKKEKQLLNIKNKKAKNQQKKIEKKAKNLVGKMFYTHIFCSVLCFKLNLSELLFPVYIFFFFLFTPLPPKPYILLRFFRVSIRCSSSSNKLPAMAIKIKRQT